MPDSYGYFGMPNHPLYRVWRGMRSRCEDPNVRSWKDYGARGIKVCRAWHSSTAFFKWAIPRYQPGLQVERRNNDRGYCPSNCYFATVKQQSRNRRDNRFLVFRGKSKTLVEWAEITGIPSRRIWMRLDIGWSVEDALTINEDRRKRTDRGRKLTFNGDTKSIREWCKILGFNKALIHIRLKHGWSVEDALSLPPSKSRKLYRAGERTAV